MRRSIRWISLVTVALLPVFAEAQSTSPWAWGVIGGLNMASASGDDIPNKEMKPGFDLGLTAQRRVNDTWSFVAEGHWTMKGVKGTESGVDVVAKLNYIEVPLLFRGMSATAAAKPFIEFGPALAFNTGCSIEASGGGMKITEDCEDAEGEINTLDYGLMGGAGLEWMGMGRPWTLGVRYNLGLAKVNDDSDAKNRNLQVLLGFRFR